MLKGFIGKYINLTVIDFCLYLYNRINIDMTRFVKLFFFMLKLRQVHSYFVYVFLMIGIPNRTLKHSFTYLQTTFSLDIFF